MMNPIAELENMKPSRTRQRRIKRHTSEPAGKPRNRMAAYSRSRIDLADVVDELDDLGELEAYESLL